jgi:hypothetical protein
MFIDPLARKPLPLPFRSSLTTLQFAGSDYHIQMAHSTVAAAVAFITMPAVAHSCAFEALKGLAIPRQLCDTITEVQQRNVALIMPPDSMDPYNFFNVVFQ